jgi:preprotein translocase subunit SecD
MVCSKEGNIMLKYWRVWLLILFLSASALAIGFKYYPYGRHVVEISFVSDTSPAKGVLEQGMLISAVNSAVVDSFDDWSKATQNLANSSVSLTVNGKDYRFFVNDTLGIDVMDIERTNLEFGLDLRGGTRIILKPASSNVTKEDITQTIATLQTRANLYGLKEMRFFATTGVDGSNYIQIEAAGVSRDIVENLLSKQGSFEAKVLKPVDVANEKGSMQIGDRFYPVSVVGNSSIEIGNQTVAENETFSLEGIEFQYMNQTNNRLAFLAKVYTGSDIELVYSDPQHSGVRPSGNGYSFYFAVLVSEKGAQKFADVTAGIPSRVDLQTGERYLDSKIYLYLDGKLVSDLNIGSELGGKIYQTPQIQGFRTTLDGATEEKLRLQTILRSGAIPTSLKIASVDIISPTLGSDFFISVFYAGILAGLTVFTIVFVRYRKLRTALPMVGISFSEVVIILGIASTNDAIIWASVMVIGFVLIAASWWKKHEIDIFAWVAVVLVPLLGLMSWTIDLAAIGGIIAAIGTSVDHQVIIADEALMKTDERRVYTVKDKIKRAFFIIFSSASTVIAAMFPLMLVGVGLIRGFAITTIVGVLVGILVTRPAYARIIESGIKKD